MATKTKKKPLKSDEAYCRDCGKAIKKKAEICPKCGIRQHKIVDQSITRGITKKKSPGDAAVLGLLFGPFGYLYVRRYGLFFMWLFVGLILVYFNKFLAVFLWIGWTIHQYNLAKEINQELDHKH